MKRRNKRNAAGFTLIEVIVVFVVAAIVGTILMTFFGDTILKSHKPRENLIKSADLNQVMVNIRADYKPYPVWKRDHPYYAGDKIMPTAFSSGGQRYWYKCNTPTGTSGSTEPDPWTTGVIPLDNSVQWIYQPTPLLLTLSQLKNKIGAVDTINKKYGYDKSTHQYGYYVSDNNWIYFDSSNNINNSTDPSDQNILKVTIKNDLGETITALFF